MPWNPNDAVCDLSHEAPCWMTLRIPSRSLGSLFLLALVAIASISWRLVAVLRLSIWAKVRALMDTWVKVNLASAMGASKMAMVGQAVGVRTKW